MKMLIAIPFTGLGLYNGFRGNRWLRNRIKIFEQFTLPSLLNQTDRDFVAWFQWRHEERNNPHVLALQERLRQIPNFTFVFTFHGVCLYDDKYEDVEARERLFESLRLSTQELFDYLPDSEEIYHLLQPSDDCYDRKTVELVKKVFREQDVQAVSFLKGYLCNYNTKEVLEYNPKTNPPFAAIRFPREKFFDTGKHMTYIGMKEDEGKYKKGTPFPSHEYLANCFKTAYFDWRGFLVGTHLDNISTVFDHPYGGAQVSSEIFEQFGLGGVEPLSIPYSFRRVAFHKLPYQVKRKLRYLAGEKKWLFRPVFNGIYNFMRG
jgi:hypothetical protein